MQRFDLLAMLRRARPVLYRMRRKVRITEITAPSGKIDDLTSQYMKAVRLWWERAKDTILPTYRQALVQTERDDASFEAAPILLGGMFVSIGAEVAKFVEGVIDPGMRDWLTSYEAWHRKRWVANLVPSGVDVKTMVGPEDVQITLGTMLQQNMSLVRNLSEETRRRMEQIIFEGFRQRTSARDIARQLSEAVGMERKRALRIAAHQTVMLSSELDTQRMKQAGITEFEWRHSGKLHFRPHHKARHGQIFKLEGEIDPDDMPGIPIWCGCKKRGVLSL